MAITTPFTARFGLIWPIVQAPMAGGVETAALVGAVCNAGAFGSIGAAYLNPDEIRARAQDVRRLTPRPFGINLFVRTPAPAPPQNVQQAVAQVTPYFTELDLPAPQPPEPPQDRFDAQLEAALESGAAVISFTFGVPPIAAIRAVRPSITIIGTATSVEEAIILERAGVDAVVAQGSEAGGHRGSFYTGFDAGLVGTLALVPQIVSAISVPVLASGGIMDGRGIAAVLVLGAQAAQMGTAFLTANEAAVPDGYKDRILGAREDETRITCAFSGRPARGLVNRVMAELDENVGAVLPFPLQNELTRPMRVAAARANRPEYLSLWAGQGVRLSRRAPAAELVTMLGNETEAAIRRLSALTNG